MTWTIDQENTLRRMWAEKYPAPAIAQEIFGDKSKRNSVLGKAHRMGLPPHAHWRTGRPNGQRTPRPDRPAPKKPTPPPEMPDAKPVRLLQLTPNTCRWPLGGPTEPAEWFCGAQPIECRPYCIKHARIAYNYVPLARPKGARVF